MRIYAQSYDFPMRIATKLFESRSIDRFGVFLGAKVLDTVAIVILWIVH